jgi:hypothetical protein
MNLLDRLALLRGPRFAESGQTVVPGLYAWAVTVGGLAFGRGVPIGARAGALVALAFLLAGPSAERRWGSRWRPAFTWGFVLSCAVAWGAGPGMLSSLRGDSLRAGAGLFGWALFAFAAALPTVDRRERPPSGDELSTPARRRLSRGDGVALAGAGALAATLQLVGWQAAGVERELLVRTVALAAGLAVIGASAEALVQRHASRVRLPVRARLRRAIRPVLVLGALGVLGVLLDRIG